MSQRHAFKFFNLLPNPTNERREEGLGGLVGGGVKLVGD